MGAKLNKPIPKSSSEERFRSILDAIPCVAFVWETKEGWPVEYVSKGIERFGYTVEEFQNHSICYKELVYADDLPRVEQELEDALLNGQTELEQKYRVVTRTGELKWVKDWTEILYDDKNSPLFAQGVILDITDTMAAEERARSYARFPLENPNPVLRVDCFGDILLTNNAANRIIEELATSSSEQKAAWKDMLSLAADLQISGRVDVDVGSSLYEFDIHHIEGKDYTNIYGSDVTAIRQNQYRMADIARSLPGALIQYTLRSDGSDEIEFISDACEGVWEVSKKALGNDPKIIWDMTDPQDIDGLRASVSQSAKDLAHWRHEWRITTPSGQQKWLRSSATPHRKNNGDTVWNTIILDVTLEANAAIAVSDALAKAISVLSSALEARDPYTAGHERQVANIALQIGKKLGLSQDQLTGLELAATVHDVGKINVPAEILSKPTKLTKEEFALIKVHPTVGADLLSDIQFEWPIADAIRQHHERLDGSGYPDGLSGDSIILEARIIAVADTLEAMASHRPYRPGLGIEKAANEIQEGAGKRYDPEVASACLELIQSGEIHF